jgi:type III secretion protein U
MSDKTEAPTEKRLRRARKDGDIAKSGHATSAASGVLWWLFLVMATPHIYIVCTHAIAAIARLDQSRPFAERYAYAMGALSATLPILLGTIGVGVLAVVLPEALQARGVFAGKRLAPDFKRLNPVEGFKNLFGLRTVFETGIEIAQLTLLMAISWYAFTQWCANLPGSFSLTFGSSLEWICGSIATVLAAMSLSQLAPAAVDLWLQRILWRRRLRMDKNEIKREFRDEEGDPYVKGRRRALHRELGQ